MEDEKQIANCAVSFFSNLCQSESHSLEQELFSVIPSLVIIEDNVCLTAPATLEELKGYHLLNVYSERTRP